VKFLDDIAGGLLSIAKMIEAGFAFSAQSAGDFLSGSIREHHLTAHSSKN
jgi:hypothetical protein